jgi:hypothetical protein
VKYHLLFALTVLCTSFSARAQTDSVSHHTSTLRGSIKIAPSGEAAIGVRVKVLATKLGAVTNANGEYRIEHIPVGHYQVSVFSSDYEPQTQEVVVSSAHQAILDFELRERRSGRDDTLTVFGGLALNPVNAYAVSSVTPFSIEDVNRYAAAFQDPPRMAENFAGVFGRGSTNNYIVVRGGSPIELLWRLDNIDIANPNHFGKNGSSGGLISAINSAMLGNSDFLTGAFPAEYGTKLSAVFDLHTRNGNTERTEGRAEISFNGLEGMAEGLLPSNGSSFLLSYRHSTLAVLREIGLLDYNTLPDFDDAMMKLHFPTGEHDNIDLTGLWGIGRIKANRTTGEEIGSGSDILVGGVDWQHIYSDKLIGHVYANYTHNAFSEALGEGRFEDVGLTYSTVKSTLTYSPNAIHAIEIGASAQRATYDWTNFNDQDFDTTFFSNNYTLFANWNWHILPELTLNTGAFGQYMNWHLPWIAKQFITTDSTMTFEPRASLAWSPWDAHTFSLAVGVHKQPEPFQFAQATHYVGGYTLRASDDLLFKAETYLKQYSDVPVHASVRDDYSFLNEGYARRMEFVDLKNTGKGRTYGAEFTALKHYSSGYFVTGTASLVRQEFAGSDGIWHFGAFDNQYILNLVSGFDIAIGSSSMMTIGEKFTIAGGGMYTPFDMARSDSTGYDILDSAHAYSARNDPYVRLDVNLEFHFNWQHSALTVFASILNALDIKNITYRNLWWDSWPGKSYIHYEYDLPILPIAGVRFEF